MKNFFLLIFLLNPSLIFAQTYGSLNIFSEDGDKFYLILDGKKQNDSARSNIRIQELPDLYYSAKIIFEDSSILPIFKNNLYVSDADDVMKDASYRIRRDNGTKARLSFYSMLPVRQNFVPAADVSVFHFGQPAVFETVTVPDKKETVPVDASAPVKLGSLNIFSQNGDKFFLFLNGVKQNETAQSNIRIQQIPGLYYNVKIVFKDTKFATIVKNNLYISDLDDNLMNATYRVRRDNAGKPKLNFYSMTKVQENFSAPAGMYVHDFEKPAENIPAVTTAKTKTVQEPVKGTISNIKVVEHSTAPASKSKTVATDKKVAAKNAATNHPELVKNNSSTVINEKKEDVIKPVAENKKCNGWPMGKGDLYVAKKSIQETAKEDAKLTVAQEAISSSCLLASQVTEFCSLFKAEKSKLAFAKYAYKFTIDRKNYAEVNKALSLETSRKELVKFISGG